MIQNYALIEGTNERIIRQTTIDEERETNTHLIIISDWNSRIGKDPRQENEMHGGRRKRYYEQKHKELCIMNDIRIVRFGNNK